MTRGKHLRRPRGEGAPPAVKAWTGTAAAQVRNQMALTLPRPCGKCGKPVTRGMAWQVGHVIDRAVRPDLTWVPSNHQPEHQACGSAGGQAAVIRKARAEGAAAALNGRGVPPVFQGGGPPGNRRTVEKTHTWVREELSWDSFAASAPEWLEDVLIFPDNANPPLAVTPVHPRAVGTFGPEACDWIEQELKGELPKGLRWWQRYAIYRQLEHDARGNLLWKTILETTPRRSGKSVRLRAMALWRIAHSELFEDEQQIVLHTGRDVAVVREIHRRAWRWATVREYEGWKVSRGVGQEEVIHNDIHRWLVRSTSSVYGYDVCMGMVDEAWDVQPEVFTEGIEPATLERISPQSVLTSTAHRRATSLMRTKISAALLDDDRKTLLLLWGAPSDADEADPGVWKSASPHWTPERLEMLTDKYEQALKGQIDPEFDDQDPMASFRSQYLNCWVLRDVERPPPGAPVVTEANWAAMEVPQPLGPPDAVSIEGWFTDGVAVVSAWQRAGLVTISATSHPTAALAAAQAASLGCTSAIQVGKSLLTNEPALRSLWSEPAQGTTAVAAREFGRMAGEGTLRHDSSPALTEQVMALRVQPAPDGMRLVSKHRSDAIKAAVWSIAAAKDMPEPSAVF